MYTLYNIKQTKNISNISLQKSGGNTAAFPMELLKTREILENNPVDEEVVKTNGNGSASPVVVSVTAKRKIDENDFDDENVDQINGKVNPFPLIVSSE